MKSLLPTLLLLFVAVVTTCGASAVPRRVEPSTKHNIGIFHHDSGVPSLPVERRSSRADRPARQAPDAPPLNPPAPRSGLYADENSCRGTDVAAVLEAINGVGLLAQAGLNALRIPELLTHPRNPAHVFFGPDVPPAIAQVLSAAALYSPPYNQQPPDDFPIRISCRDESGSCATNPRVHAYVDNGFYDTIVVCPPFFHFPSLTANPPCIGGLSPDGLHGLGATSRAQILLHEFMHAFSEDIIIDHEYGTRGSMRLKLQSDPARKVEENADSYARFASWAYDLGSGRSDAATNNCLDALQLAMFHPDTGEYPTDEAWWASVLGPGWLRHVHDEVEPGQRSRLSRSLKREGLR